MTDTLARMRQLVGTTAQWQANDLILGDGEIAVERQVGNVVKMKIGDGTTRFSGLPYATGEAVAGVYVPLSRLSAAGGSAAYDGRVPMMGALGFLDPSMFDAVVSQHAPGKLVKTNTSGMIDNALIDSTTTGGLPVHVGKVVRANGAGLVDHSLLDLRAIDVSQGGPSAGQLIKLGANGRISDTMSALPYIAASTGPADADKAPKTNPSGKLDVSFLPMGVAGQPSSSGLPIPFDATGKIAVAALPAAALAGGTTYLGSFNVTGNPPAATAGQYILVRADGTVGPAWTGAVGETAYAGDIMIFDGTQWDLYRGTHAPDTYLPLSGGTISGSLVVTMSLSVAGGINSDNGLYYFGAADAAHPALRRAAAGTMVEVVTGDQSGHADLMARHLMLGGNVTVGGGTLVLGAVDRNSPALRRSANALDAILADASGYAPMNALQYNAMGGLYLFGAGDASRPALRASNDVLEVMLGDMSGHAPLQAKQVNAVTGTYYFGAGDAAHPMLRRSGTTLEVVLGDQSGYAGFKAGTANFYGPVEVQGNAFASNFVIGSGVATDAGSTGFGATGNGPYINYYGNGYTGAGAVSGWMEFIVGGTSRGYIRPDTGELTWNAAINAAKPPANDSSGKVPTTQWVREQMAVSGGGFVAGDIKTTASPNAQAGWYDCDGSLKSRTTDAALFAAIGTTWNTGGEPDDQFRLPDFNGRTLFGTDNGKARLGGVGARPGGFTGNGILGEYGGAQSHTLSKGEIPPPGGGGDVGSFATAEPFGPSAWQIGAGGNFYNASFGYGGAAHNNMPPGAVVRYLIKA